MKYLKLFLLLAAAPFIASCSDDDDFNTAQCTLGFQSELLKTKESAGFFNVPITIEGLRNGNVNVTITTTLATSSKNPDIIGTTVNPIPCNALRTTKSKLRFCTKGKNLRRRT